MTNASNVVVTGTGAVCAAGMAPDDILDAVVAGRSAIAPDQAMGYGGLALPPRRGDPDFNPRALVDDRKLHKLIRRTDLARTLCGRSRDRAGRASSRHRDALAG